MARPTEIRALTAILNSIERNERISNLEEFARILGLSAKSRISGVLANLEKEGFIECDRTRTGRIQTSSIRIAKMRNARPVPVLGRVAAGQPLLANEEDITEFVPLPAQHVRGTEVFMLKVQGDSMIGDGILNGDYVIVLSERRPRDGEIAVVLIGDEATVKHIWYEDGAIRLVSSNTDFPDQTYGEADQPVIQGKVIGLVRWSI
jgi:repressor LexA